jgi:transposase
MSIDDSLPTDLASAHALIIAQRQALIAAESEAQHRALLIEKLKYTIKKLRHEQFGQSSERGALLDQLELQLADLEEDVAQAEAAAASEMITVPSFERRKPARCPRICRASHSSSSCKLGCASSARGSRSTVRPAKRSTIASSAGRHSPASSTMVDCA